MHVAGEEEANKNDTEKLSATEIYLVIRYSYSHLLNAALECLNQQNNKK